VWDVLFEWVVEIESGEGKVGTFLSSDCRVIVLLPIPPFTLFTTPSEDGLP